ncbi:MAG: GNAT family N-acetyltransferase [Rhodococcus sp. (in: high G+C Gram-positive bacteria)]
MKTCVATVAVRTYADSDAIHAEWERLAERVGTVFSSKPSFVRNVVRAQALNVEYVTVHRDDRLVALAPLFKVRRGPVVVAKIVGTNLGVPLELLSEDDDSSDRLLAAIASRGYMLSADSLIGGERTVKSLIGHRAWTVKAEVRERVPVVRVQAGRGASDIRGKKSLKRLRQYRNEIGRHSTLRYEVISDRAHLDERWKDITALAAKAVEKSDKVNYLVSPHGEFALDFLRDEASAGALCIAGLVVDDVWVAHEIGIRTRNRMEGWLTHYDSRFAKLQPGHQLIEWFVDNHDALGVSELDQGVGVNEIKSAWAKSGYDVLTVSAVPRSWKMSEVWARALSTYAPAVSYVRNAVWSTFGRFKSSTIRIR